MADSLGMACLEVCEIGVATGEAKGALRLGRTGLVQRGMVGVGVLRAQKIDHVARQIAALELSFGRTRKVRRRSVEAIFPMVEAGAGGGREGAGATTRKRTIRAEIDI